MVIIRGWTVDKSKVSYYAFKDKSKSSDIEDFIIEDAINLLETELNKVKDGLSASVDKTDGILNQAIIYFVCCLMAKAGIITQNSGSIQSESMEGMSVSYGQESNQNTQNKSIPKDWCALALDMLFRYAASHKLRVSRIRIGINNVRDQAFAGIYDKYKGE